MAKEYLDKEGLKRLVELLKGEIGKAGSGNSILYYDNMWGRNLDGSPSSYIYLINESHFSGKPNDGDLAISNDGVLFRIDKTNSTSPKGYYLATLKGTDGKDGKSILYCSSEWLYNADGTPTNNCQFMTSSFSETPKEGDWGITSDGILFKVNGFIMDVCLCVYLSTLKGTDGKDGNMIMPYPYPWTYESDGTPVAISEDLFTSDFYEIPSVGDVAVSEEGVLFRIHYLSDNREYCRGTYITTLKVQADLSEYVKKTQKAAVGVLGLIALSNTYCTQISSAGALLCRALTLDEYEKASASAFVSKGTLDAVLNGFAGDINTVLESILGV